MTGEGESRLEEENVARLLAAALGEEARPGRELRAQAYRRLLAALRGQPAAVAFPDGVAVLLGVWLVAAVCAFAGLAVADGLAAPGGMAWLLLAAGPLANLALLPVAAAVIVLRRKHEAHAF